MADPSTDLQNLASGFGITYEAEENFHGQQFWRWDVSSVSADDISQFYLEAEIVNGYISADQNGLSILPGQPLAPDDKLRMPTLA